MSKTITLPISLFKKFSETSKIFEEFNDELEDFLLSSNPKFISKMRQSRQNHIQENTRSLAELKKELCIK
ncbi:MAG: hypothetical protein AB1498_11190 [bacterium]